LIKYERYERNARSVVCFPNIFRLHLSQDCTESLRVL